MTKSSNPSLGQRIKSIRVNRKETLEKFASAIQQKANNSIKTTKSNVSKWEKGLNIPNDIALKAIAELGETSVEYLLTGRISIQEAIKQNISMKTYAEANGFSSSEIAKHDKIYKENIDILSEQVKTHFERAFNSALYSLMEIHQKSPDKFIELAVFLEILSDIPLEEEKQTTQQKEILDFIRKVTFND